MRALSACSGAQQILVHSGQHYDLNMSEVFFQQLGMPAPDFNLQIGSGSHAQQTAAVMSRFEPILTESRSSLLIVYGDVNSTLAAALVASKLGVAIAHVEAGLRSFDRSMPEEINRVITDQISNLLFTPSEDGNHNLKREGISPERVHLVGNVMIDTLVHMLPQAHLPALDLPDRYILVTLHRPSNVDDIAWLEKMLASLNELSDHAPVLFPVHPRTRKALANSTVQSCKSEPGASLSLIEPQPYLEFLALEQHAALVITDSGGIQEETTFLGVPCLTVRDNTERPVTIECGTNQLVGRDLERLRAAAHEILSGKTKKGTIPPLWDGHAAERIAQVVSDFCGTAARKPKAQSLKPKA